MHRTRRILNLLALICCVTAVQIARAESPPQIIRLATTTSTDNSGLLHYLLPFFESTHHATVQVIAVGTGKALELAKNGDVDLALVHARRAEDQFVAAGYGVNRRDVMANDFIIVGPDSDPAGIVGMHDLNNALRQLVARKVRFISRGDNSGTDQMEQSYWQRLGARPVGDNYVSAGLGMGEVLGMAAQLQAYTLTDRATYATYRARTGLVVAVEGDPAMFNPYGVIAVNPARYPDLNSKGANQLIDWITSPVGQQHIAAFRVNGVQVFFPHGGH